MIRGIGCIVGMDEAPSDSREGPAELTQVIKPKAPRRPLRVLPTEKELYPGSWGKATRAHVAEVMLPVNDTERQRGAAAATSQGAGGSAAGGTNRLLPTHLGAGSTGW